MFCSNSVNSLTPKSDSITPESNIKVTRIKEMITTKEALDCQLNFPGLHPRIFKGKIIGNMHNDVRV